VFFDPKLVTEPALKASNLSAKLLIWKNIGLSGQAFVNAKQRTVTTA
jgi:hypothetical protein